MQKLELADRFFPAVMSGEKVNTLRGQEGDIKEGFLLFYSFDTPNLKTVVWVHTIRLASMDTFSEFYQMSPGELHASMVNHYPDIKIDSEVTLVDFLSPLETYRQHGIPEDLKHIFGSDYIKKIKNYD